MSTQSKVEHTPRLICKHCGEPIEPTGGKLYLYTHVDSEQQKCLTAVPQITPLRCECGLTEHDLIHHKDKARSRGFDSEMFHDSEFHDFHAATEADAEEARKAKLIRAVNEALLFAPTPPGTFLNSAEGANAWLARYREWFDGMRTAAIRKAKGEQ